MPLLILRCVFVLVTVSVMISVVNSPELLAALSSSKLDIDDAGWLVAIVVLGSSALAIGVDMMSKQKNLDVISSVFFGIVTGLFLTYVFGLALTSLLENNPLFGHIRLVFGVIICYFCISVLLQTRHDFRLIIPYVEFAKEVKGHKPLVLDTSVVIDGRIADLADTHVIEGQLIMPRFMLLELQNIADSSDKLRRTRGRRGLDILNRIRNSDNIDLVIHDQELPEMNAQPNDLKLVLLAKHLGGKVVTGDYNLNKVAKLHNVDVINLNDVANSLKPVFLPGEKFDVKIIKPGEESGQGIGYLDDGTMIVVEGGRAHVGDQIEVGVTSVLQTSAGRMIFGKLEQAAS